MAVELEIAGQRRWFLKGEMEVPPLPAPLVPTPSPEPPRRVVPTRLRIVAPPADFLRIARRPRHGRHTPALLGSGNDSFILQPQNIM
jgi:hypothetical protein